MIAVDCIHAGLYIRGQTLDPDRLSTALAVTPTISQFKGSRVVTATGRVAVSRMGVWAFSVDTNGASVLDTIRRLLSQLPLGDVRRVIDATEGVDEAYIDLFVAGTGDESAEGCQFDLSPEILSDLATMQLPLRVTTTLERQEAGVRNDESMPK